MTMLWPFIVSRSLSLSKNIHAPIDAVLSILHDPHALLTLSPLIVDKTSDPSNPLVYTITERLTVLGYFETRTVFKCTFTFLRDGLNTEIVAGAGTEMKTGWRVKSEQDGSTTVTEHVTVQGISILMPFILGTMTSAHHATMNNLAMRVGGVGSRDLAGIPSPSLPPILKVSLLVIVTLCITSYYNYSHSATSTAIAGLLIVTWLSWTSMDPYGLFHLSLNQQSNEDSPRTEWLNMGFWKDTNKFPEACEALAVNLAQAAKCQEGGKVLDVGHGTGESLIFLLSHPSVPRPSHITGITTLLSHHQRSRNRVDNLQRSERNPTTQVALHMGDAVYRAAVPTHPLSPTSNDIFDTILVLDCAYHFNTRNLFLRQCFAKLAPGGRIALADICFSSSALESHRCRMITSILRLMPSENKLSTEDYVSEMQKIGYVDVILEDITADVFPGFVEFLKGRGLGWWGFGTVIDWYASAGARFVIASGSRAI